MPPTTAPTTGINSVFASFLAVTKTKLSIERLALCGVDRVAKRRTNSSNIFLRMRFALVSLSSSPFSIGWMFYLSREWKRQGYLQLPRSIERIWFRCMATVSRKVNSKATLKFLKGLLNCVVYCHLLFRQSHWRQYSAPPLGDLLIAPFTAPQSVCPHSTGTLKHPPLFPLGNVAQSPCISFFGLV